MALIRGIHGSVKCINWFKDLSWRNYSRMTRKCRELELEMPWGHISAKEWLPTEDDDEHFRGRRVLGIHGWQDNSGTFDTLVPLLRNDFHLVAIDLPGHGLSSPKPEGRLYYNFDYVTDIERVRRQLGWKNFSLIGHSFGGALSLAYSAAFPFNIIKLICIDTFNVVMVKEALGLPCRLAKGIDQLLEHEERSFRGPPPTWRIDEAVEKYVNSFLDHSLTEESAKILLRRGAVQVEDDRVRFTRDPRLKFKSPHGVTLEQYHTLCQGVRCEVLLIAAKCGLVRFFGCSVRDLDLIMENLLNAKRSNLIYVEGTHHVHLNNPETVAPHINQFF